MTIFFAVCLVMQPPTSPSSQASQNPTVRLFDARTHIEVTADAIAADAKRCDAVVLGEEHDNRAAHRFYAALCPKLIVARPDAVFSMEMFERDVQGVMDDYLRGRLDEKKFLSLSRPWKNYVEDYRPQIELAKLNRLDVIAGNLPRLTAGQYVGSDSPVAPLLPRSLETPKDKYWTLFMDAMKSHPGMAVPAADGMYRAQCAKDEAMAESIADYLDRNPHRRPLVIHRCGNFHSDYGLGTVARLVRRAPLLQACVVSTIAVPDLSKPDLSTHWQKAHYLLVTAEPPSRKAATTAGKSPTGKPPTPETKPAPTKSAIKPSVQPTVKAPVSTDPPK